MVPADRRGGLVDAHVHFWDSEAREHAWLRSEPELNRPWGPSDYVPDAPSVAGVIAVEADCLPEEAQAEVDWLASLDAPGSAEVRVLGIVAAAAVETAEGRELVARHADHERVVGIRRNLQDESPGAAATEQMVQGVRRVGAHGLTFDLCLRAHQLAEVTDLVRRCEEVSFVLDHCGKPGIATDGFAVWARDLELLAALPNVVCKLSGLATESGPELLEEIPAYLRHAVETFGSERLLFGSDWPLCSTVTTWTAWRDLVERAVATEGPAAKAAVLGDNARRVYGLDGKETPWR